MKKGSLQLPIYCTSGQQHTIEIRHQSEFPYDHDIYILTDLFKFHALFIIIFEKYAECATKKCFLTFIFGQKCWNL